MYVRVWNEGGLAQLLFAQTNSALLVDYLEKRSIKYFYCYLLANAFAKSMLYHFYDIEILLRLTWEYKSD